MQIWKDSKMEILRLILKGEIVCAVAENETGSWLI